MFDKLLSLYSTLNLYFPFIEQSHSQSHTMQYPNMQVATAQSSAAHLPATPAPAVKTTIQPTKRIYPRSFFYQRGKYWTTEQVHALNCVSEKNVTPIDLLGSSFPTDEKILKCMPSFL